MTSIFGLFDAPNLFRNQSYDELKKKCLEKKELFKDPFFTPSIKSLFQSLKNDSQLSNEIVQIKWKRPYEIVKNPYLFVNGVTSNDVLQGRLGNCWFVAVCACITVYRENWMMLIPDYKSQEWNASSQDATFTDKSNYCGIFKFRFWRYGSWVEIVIDDLLPTLNDELIYCHSNYRNEFWSALLEKAYAKLLGSYEALEGGEMMDSLLDFTGGIIEPINISKSYRDSEEKLFNDLLKAHGSKALIACAIPASNEAEQEAQTPYGLVIGHAYAVIGVTEVTIDPTFLKDKLPYRIACRMYLDDDEERKIRMVRVRNPWGQQEWSGSFCDGSEDWKFITQLSQHKMSLVFQDDGEFWMPLHDFLDNFRTLLICHQMQSITGSSSSLFTMYRETAYHGRWTHISSGGCLNYRETFLDNPQYIFDIKDPDGDEVMISLTQKTFRGIKQLSRSTGLLHIGFSVFRTEVNRCTKVKVLDHLVLVSSSAFKNSRSVFARLELTRGRYLIVPCTFNSFEYGEFLLRIYCPSPIDSIQLSHIKSVSMLNPNIQNKTLVALFKSNSANTIISRLTLLKACNLPRLDPINGANPYVLLLCEKQKAFSSIKTRTLDPDWSESFLFYRTSFPKEPIYILLYNKSGILDEFLGRQVVKYIGKDENEVIALKLLNRHSNRRSETFLPSIESNSSVASTSTSADPLVPIVYLKHTVYKLTDINLL